MHGGAAEARGWALTAAPAATPVQALHLGEFLPPLLVSAAYASLYVTTLRRERRAPSRRRASAFADEVVLMAGGTGTRLLACLAASADPGAPARGREVLACAERSDDGS